MRLIVTTTDSIEGCRIVEYIDVLRSSVVVGNDIALGDLFGGNRNYNNRLNDIYEKAMQGLRLKASIAGQLLDMVYLRTENILSRELGQYFLNGCTGLYFMVEVAEPVDLTFDNSQWEPVEPSDNTFDETFDETYG